MNELPPEAASLLEQARRADHLPEREFERALASLHARLPFAERGAAADAGEAGRSAPATLGQAGLAGKTIKLVLVSAVLGGMVGGAMQLSRSGDRREHVAVATEAAPQQAFAAQASSLQQAPSPQPAERRDGPALEHPLRPAAAPRGSFEGAPGMPRAKPAAQSSRRVQAVATSASTRRAPRRSASMAGAEERAVATRETKEAALSPARLSAEDAASPQAAPSPMPEAPLEARASEPPAAQPAPPPLASGELDLIDAAIASLRDGEETRALALLERHRARYPDGKFAVERKGLRVLALCAVGRLEEGRAEREALLRSERAAPILARVRKACTRDANRP